MICTTFLCAQAVLTEKNTNQISVINIYERLNSNLFPFALPVAIYIAVSKEEADPLESTVILTIQLNNTEIFRHPITIVFPEINHKYNLHLNMQGLLISEPGELLFETVYEEKVLKTFSIAVGS